MTRDECLYIWDIIDTTLSNPEKYKTQKRQRHKVWIDLFFENIHAVTIWYSPRASASTILDNECIDCINSTFHLHGTTIFGTFLDIESKDDIDSLALQYQVLYDTKLIYDLVLASYVYKLMMKYNHISVSVYTKDILSLRDKT